ncbi:MAG TPA: PEP-CTERM sorting domain-containing protein [Opitutus sp.]|nr:PEP-CTERM sorting domain-containing protein [Opitutus sp.]
MPEPSTYAVAGALLLVVAIGWRRRQPTRVAAGC